jgi:hypothetical protein
MLDQMTVIYCICDEVFKSFNVKDDVQCKMSYFYPTDDYIAESCKLTLEP